MGLTFDKLLIIGVIAVFLLGPERLPHYAAQLGRLVRGVRDMANGAKERMREEMGPEFDEVDWKKLDPRQYDPGRLEEARPPAIRSPPNHPRSADRRRTGACSAAGEPYHERPDGKRERGKRGGGRRCRRHDSGSA